MPPLDSTISFCHPDERQPATLPVYKETLGRLPRVNTSRTAIENLSAASRLGSLYPPKTLVHARNVALFTLAEAVLGTVSLQRSDHSLCKRTPSVRSSSRRSKLADSFIPVHCISIQFHKKCSYEPHFPTPNH